MSADIHIQQGNALCGQNTECVNIRTRGQQGNRQAQSFGLREFATGRNVFNCFYCYILVLRNLVKSPAPVDTKSKY